MAHAARIFVSYAPEDSAWCHAFVQALREAGADVWYDERHLGDGFLGAEGEESARELRARPIFIAILSPASLAWSWVQPLAGVVGRQRLRWLAAHVLPGREVAALPVREAAKHVSGWHDATPMLAPDERSVHDRGKQ
jgi:hypothetical protein